MVATIAMISRIASKLGGKDLRAPRGGTGWRRNPDETAPRAGRAGRARGDGEQHGALPAPEAAARGDDHQDSSRDGHGGLKNGPVRPPQGVQAAASTQLPSRGPLEIAHRDQARTADVDEPVPEHVGTQQHLAVAPFEPAQDSLALVSFTPRRRKELTCSIGTKRGGPPTAAETQAGDRRGVGTPQPHDDVRQPAEPAGRCGPRAGGQAARTGKGCGW